MISRIAALVSLPLALGALRLETHVNTGLSFDMVSSLIIGTHAAVLIDLPMAIPQAESLADWVRRTTDKPLFAVFITHPHSDHYLSGASFLAEFPAAQYYSNPLSAAQIGLEAETRAQGLSAAFGAENISPEPPAIPSPYDFSFFVLPGDEDEPIHLLNPLTGDTPHHTLFWIPSTGALIAGDAVHGRDTHLWLADFVTPQLTESALSTLNLIDNLQPSIVVPGHSLTNKNFGPSADVEFSREYLRFWQTIERQGLDHFTPQEIFRTFDERYPLLLEGNNTSSSTFILNATAEQFGRGGIRQQHMIDLAAFNRTQLDGWRFAAGCSSSY
jgi:glyoxylase-like metal-dependent hydrolase (beta-lactamase superfamily II)